VGVLQAVRAAGRAASECATALMGKAA
jgi:hypothetical protein